MAEINQSLTTMGREACNRGGVTLKRVENACSATVPASSVDSTFFTTNNEIVDITGGECKTCYCNRLERKQNVLLSYKVNKR